MAYLKHKTPDPAYQAKSLKKRIQVLFAVIYVAAGASLVHGYVASSTNFILQSDSVNFGGQLSTSTNYKLEDTLGEIGTGIYASSTSVLNGGYQAMSLDVYLAVTAPANATMTPVINGVGGGVSTSSATWKVETDNPAGYELSVRTDTSPALKAGAASFDDYTPSYTDPDYVWSTPDRQARFGFTAEGDDIVQLFRDNGVSCNAGNLDTPDRCWAGLSTTNEVIARSSSPTSLTGATTTLKFKAEVGAKKPQGKGVYSASITVTAITL